MYRKVDGKIVELTQGTDQNQGVHINNISQIVWGARPDGVTYWENDQERLLTDWGRPSGINNVGLIAVHRWHADIQVWQQWAWIDGNMIRITDEPYSNVDGEPNDWGEVAWEARMGTRLADNEIRLMTWVEQNADINGSGATSLADYEILVACFTGPDEAVDRCACHRGDLDHDGDVDLSDFTYFQQSRWTPP
jgi:hypothetical protein